MDIYSPAGTKIKYSRPNCGYLWDQVLAAQHLVPRRVYTVEMTDVDHSHTTVYLKEVPGVGFNSVLFENLTMFDKVRVMMPKLKEQFITPKLAYMARSDDAIIVKVDRGCVFVLKSDGTYEVCGVKQLHKELK